ncbi:MAG: CDP-alcohol phosphatidyltransferase family protein [Candidatus Aminicenantes bacterium]
MARWSSFFTIPNIITLARILLIPFFLYFMLQKQLQTAFIIFLLAVGTDFVDGAAARILNQKSKWGALLDPAGDKLLMTTSFILLTIPSISSPNHLPVWLTVGVISRDIFIVTGSAMVYHKIRQTRFPPTLLGKMSTIMQMVTLVLVLYYNFLSREMPLLQWVYLLTFTLTVFSGIHYAAIGVSWIKNAGNKRG